MMGSGWVTKGALRRDETGVTAIEFAMAAPVFVLMLTGLFDLGFQVYAQSVLQGAMQEAARSSTLEGAGTNTGTLDSMVETNVRNVIPGAQLAFTRTNYASFDEVGLAEDFTDTNGDLTCNNGEPFEDVNDNGVWDTDRGVDGVGGARDAVLYDASASFDRVFPLHNFLGLPEQITINGSTVLRNQPYDEQATREPEVGNCT